MKSAAHALADVRRVRVGTTNDQKIRAAIGAMAGYAPDAAVEGAAVDSGVSPQPVGFEEISLGARNRAARAFAFGDCDLAVGYEDGLVELLALGDDSGNLFNVGCAAVTDGSLVSLGLSSGFAYPPQCAEAAVRDRAPIGDLFDTLWAERSAAIGLGSAAESEGNIGKLSLGVLGRSEYARHAIVCALVRFLHPDLYVESAAPTQSVA